jgi:alkylation response protein AidB-like acyl-CoA dehydrogenase
MTYVLSVVRSTADTDHGFDIDAATERLAAALAATAIERDRSGGHAVEQRRAIRDSGLLALTVPREHGGLGADLNGFYRVVRRLAQVDSALAHVFAFHHLQVYSVRLYGHAEQRRRLLRQTVDEQVFWGNALNPRDRNLRSRPVEGGWRLDGSKSFASGALGSDRLTLSAHVAADGDAPPPYLIGNIATRSPGITVRDDWDAFGQRQTDSGTVQFENVFLPQSDVLQIPGIEPRLRSTLRTLVSQLLMANLFVGIAEGAYDAARHYTLKQAQPWPATGLTRSAEDPYVLHRYGELWLLLRPAQLAADAAALQLQQALDRDEALTSGERGAAAVAVAEAKVLAHRASVEVSSQLFELTGARSTSARFGLDRFWRNARVHTLHDPVDYKLRDIGRYRLEGRAPEPTAYS